MSAIVVAATPLTGHTTPLLRLAEGLVGRGHDVTVIAATCYGNRVTGFGARFVPLTGAADWDPSEIDTLFPARVAIREHSTERSELSGHDLAHLFGDGIPDGHAVLQRVLAQHPDAPVLVDQFFFGAWPTLLGAPGVRPRRLVGVGLSPVFLRSRDTSALGPIPVEPGGDPARANLAVADAMAARLGAAQRHIAGLLAECGATDPIPFVMDAIVTVPDVFAQLTVPEFEFPRSDAPPELRFVGALRATPTGELPDLPGDRPLVVVTQGTMANDDLARLVEPTLTACADLDVTVLAAIGRASYDGPVPANAMVLPWVSYADVLPRAAVFVTNGGYGGVQDALVAGVPVIAAGVSEDKPVVASRVARLGYGRDLGTDRPSVEQVRSAVLDLLADVDTRARATALRDAYARYDPVDGVLAALDLA